MDNKAISNWLRQVRYRANKRGIFSDLQISDIIKIIEEYDGHCAYCNKSKKCLKQKIITLDHVFPLSRTTPNVPANILPSCKMVKSIKKNNDLVWLFSTGVITQDIYITILKSMFKRRGGDLLKQHIKIITGIHDNSNLGPI